VHLGLSQRISPDRLIRLCFRHNNQIAVVIEPGASHLCEQDEIACFAYLSRRNYNVFVSEITMPKINLSGMTVEALIDLQKRVDKTLHQRRAELEQQLERMDALVAGRSVVRGRRSVLKGRKVPPKYRGPSGETWAGRGARPRWLVAAIKGGRKLDDFLIDKSGRKGRRKRRSKQ
jgi:DNA-binding protein H-NS